MYGPLYFLLPLTSFAKRNLLLAVRNNSNHKSQTDTLIKKYFGKYWGTTSYECNTYHYNTITLLYRFDMKYQHHQPNFIYGRLDACNPRLRIFKTGDLDLILLRHS